MTNATKSVIAVGSLATFIALGYFAFRTDPQQPEPIRVDTVDTIAPAHSTTQMVPYEMESVQPNVYHPTPEELPSFGAEPISDAEFEDVLAKMSANERASLETQIGIPILDERPRECVAIPIVANPKIKRMNLQLLPNLREVVRERWSNATWRESVRIGQDDKFPVNLWRSRNGTVTFWTTVRVPAGPNLPSGTPQFPLDAEFFRGGDVLLVEASKDGALLIAYAADDPRSKMIVEPRLSVIEPSNDPTPTPGVWTTISGSQR